MILRNKLINLIWVNSNFGLNTKSKCLTWRIVKKDLQLYLKSFKKSTDSAPSKSNDEIIDLTSKNNDDIIVMVEVACDLPSRDSSDTNNNNMGKNSQINDDSELFRIDYAQDDNRPVLKTQNFSKYIYIKKR